MCPLLTSCLPDESDNHCASVDNRRESMYRSVQKQIDEGRQVYIVYPLIKESEKIDLKNLEEGYQHILEEFPKCKVCKVHGKNETG